MCINDESLKYESRNLLTKRQKNLCNEQLAVNRDLICCVLAAQKTHQIKPMKCLEGIGVCGINGMIWKKYFGDDVDITINGFFAEDADLIGKNLRSNEMKIKVLNEDPCLVLRKELYDFIFLNCQTNTSFYLDSIFSNIKDDAILVITTSEDPSLYWQMPEVALRNYGGVIVKTSYHREVAVRLVVAEMARTCAKYSKGLKILCTVSYKPQQSFTIVAQIKKGIKEAKKCVDNIKKLAHCNLCENRNFIPNHCYLDKRNNELSCNCSNQNEGKIIVGIGPLWSGEIFDEDFIELMVKKSKEFPWESRVFSLLKLIQEEARCKSGNIGTVTAEAKRPKLSNIKSVELPMPIPYFYYNTHRYSPKEFGLRKLSDIVRELQNRGFRASRTHFDSAAIRTDAPFNECIKILKGSSCTDQEC